MTISSWIETIIESQYIQLKTGSFGCNFKKKRLEERRKKETIALKNYGEIR